TRSRPISDWVMVCSSTLRAKPVTHSTKRCWPRWVKPTAIGNRMACQSDHSGVTFIAHLLEGWFVGGHNRQAPSRRCACQSTRLQDNGERHCQTLDFTRNYCIEGDSGGLPAHVRRFGANSCDLHAIADWLKECGVTTVAMESTGVYWIPLFELLEARGFEVWLVEPGQ